MSKVIYLTKENFKKEVMESSVPVLVDFWAAWCGPCKMIGPILDELSEEVKGVKICKVNVDEEGELANEYKIRSIPTLLVFKNGQKIEQMVGAQPKGTLKSKLESYI